MRGFQENNCRLCQKVFCCKKCRMKHEASAHKVFSNCDICIYGKIFCGNLDNQLLQHLESSHLPLHCIYCKKVFSSVEDLQHKKCDYFQCKELSPKTPFKISTPPILICTDDYDSPILQELQRQEYLNCILATSTPMQRGEEPNIMFDKSKEVITPVDKPCRVANKSIIKKTDSAKSDEQLSKRRVTFGETPADTLEKNMKGCVIKESKDQEITSGEGLESLKVQDKKSNDTSTPVTGMSTAQFYSAKTETGQFYSAKTDASFKLVRDNSDIKNSLEGSTPVGIPSRSKLINLKGDIYKKQDEELNGISANNCKNVVNLDEVSMELCTPAKHLSPLESIKESVDTLPVNNTTSISENMQDGQGNNETKDDSSICTPARASNPGKIVIIGDFYKNTVLESISPISEVTQKNENCNKDNSQNEAVDDLDVEKVANLETTGHDTLWLSAINLEKTNEPEQQNDENKQPTEKNKPNQERTSLLDTLMVSPQRSNQRRVSIAMPTPILKTTNVQMKFHFPAHLSSTPIMSSGAMKLKQTKMIRDISSRVIQQQTPYKTPQGRLCELVQRKLVDANLRQNLDPLSDTAAGPSTAVKEMVPLENIKEDFSSCDTALRRDVAGESYINEEYDDTYPSVSHEPGTGVSVSSMTESNLWSSMTRIVKSVFGGFSNISQGSSNTYINTNTSSFKRQLSDSDSGDFLEAPRLKRFKFTDIKCRRAIRDLPALELPRSFPAPAPPLASIEIMKSVSTLYGIQTVRIQCDKATQTDNYLMYGWHPHV